MKPILILIVIVSGVPLYSQESELEELTKRKKALELWVQPILDSIEILENRIQRIEEEARWNELNEKERFQFKLNKTGKIRKAPTAFSDIVSTLPQGHIVEGFDKSGEYIFIKAKHPQYSATEVEGWINEILLRKNAVYKDFLTFLTIRNKQEAERKRQEELHKKQVREDYNDWIQDRQEEIAKQRESRKQQLILLYGDLIGRRIFNGEFWIGMTDKMARESLGDPDDINRSVGSWGVHEQWVYERPNYQNVYLYFENGVLKSYQE
jgi:hypothetical protein